MQHNFNIHFLLPSENMLFIYIVGNSEFVAHPSYVRITYFTSLLYETLNKRSNSNVNLLLFNVTALLKLTLT